METPAFAIKLATKVLQLMAMPGSPVNTGANSGAHTSSYP
jgi:hypothetical protein